MAAKRLKAETGTLVAWEERVGNKWVPKKHSFNIAHRLGAVLKEMRQQDSLRNITLVKE